MRNTQPPTPPNVDLILQNEFAVFPLAYNTKIPPAGSHGYKDATTDREAILKWFGTTNYGIATGKWREGRFLIVIDVDVKNNQKGNETYKTITTGLTINTLTVSTPSGGRHYYFGSNQAFTNGNNKISAQFGQNAGIDIRGVGGHIVGPGSSIDDVFYKVTNDVPIQDLPIELEKWLVPAKRTTIRVIDSPEANVEEEKSSDASIPGRVTKGSRNNTLFDHAIKYFNRSTEATLADGIDFFTKFNEINFIPPLSTQEVERTVTSAFSYRSVDGPEWPGTPWTFRTVDAALKFFDGLGFKRASREATPVVFRKLPGDDNGLYVEYYSKRNFLDKFDNKQVEIREKGKDGTKIVSAAELWLKSTTESYDRVIFYPTAYPENEKSGDYNLWEGFAYKPENNGMSRSFQQFIWEIICSKNEEEYDFLIDLMAQQVQHPEKKETAGIAVVLRGEPGIGKSFFCESFGALWGAAYQSCESKDFILGGFNSLLDQKVIISLPEVLWGGDRKADDIFKEMITSSRMVINEKYIAHRGNVPNYLRFYLSTNETWAAPVETIMDRRYFCLDVSSIHQKDEIYFNQLQQDLENGGYADFLNFLLHHDYSKRNFQAIPNNRMRSELVEQSLCGFQGWLYNRIIVGTLEVPSFGDTRGGSPNILFLKNGFDIDAGALQDTVRRDTKDNYLTAKSIGMSIQRYFPTITKLPRDKDGKTMYRFPKVEILVRDFERIIGRDNTNLLLDRNQEGKRDLPEDFTFNY